MKQPDASLSDRNNDGSVRLAVLIDADNAQSSILPAILAEIAKLGVASVKRIYGDFTSPHSNRWKEFLYHHAIKPIQQFAYTTGKNATDSALIIDAMDLLYTGRFDGFCIISSDSDFTGLALRIREEGLLVVGFGEQKTPLPFRNACHKFVLTEILTPSPKPRIPSKPPTKTRTEKKSSSLPSPPPASSPKPLPAFPEDLFRQALEQNEEDSDWISLSRLSNQLIKLRPDFDSRLYGHAKLSALLRSRPDLFALEERPAPNGTNKIFYTRILPP